MARNIPPLPIGNMPNFPTLPSGTHNTQIEFPLEKDIEIGDILVSRYEHSKWADWLVWENWHHAAIIVKKNPLTIVEAIGANRNDQPEGPALVTFKDAVGFGSANDLLAIKWLKPIFPNPIRLVEKGIKWGDRKIISETEARRLVVAYALEQTKKNSDGLLEPYSLKASKWSEDKWYCSLLPYKSYSMTVTGLYLEDYEGPRGGWWVTPEDLLDSQKTEEYFTWEKGKYHA